MKVNETDELSQQIMARIDSVIKAYDSNPNNKVQSGARAFRDENNRAVLRLVKG